MRLVVPAMTSTKFLVVEADVIFGKVAAGGGCKMWCKQMGRGARGRKRGCETQIRRISRDDKQNRCRNEMQMRCHHTWLYPRGTMLTNKPQELRSLY